MDMSLNKLQELVMDMLQSIGHKELDTTERLKWSEYHDIELDLKSLPVWALCTTRPQCQYITEQVLYFTCSCDFVMSNRKLKTLLKQ